MSTPSLPDPREVLPVHETYVGPDIEKAEIAVGRRVLADFGYAFQATVLERLIAAERKGT